MVAQAVLTWMVSFASLLALFGFVLYVGRAFSGRGWSGVALLRVALELAAVGATALWVLLVMVD